MKSSGFRAESDVSLAGLQGSSLVLSCVSVGNVGQLAVDVILASLLADGELTLLSQLHHPAVLPLAGRDPVQEQVSSGVSCGMGLYLSAKHRLVLLQVRSALLPGTTGEFCADLVGWCKELGLNRIFCLTSSLAHERQESQLTGSSFRYLASQNFSLPLPDHFVRLEARKTMDNHDNEVYLPGSGAATTLLKLCSEAGLEMVILSKFCEEGDNTREGLFRDGMELADYSNELCGWSKDRRYRAPHSWRLMFGPAPPTEMFW